MMISFFLITMALCLSKLTIHSLSHNFPIEMRLEWRLGKISVCFSCLDKKFSVILDWCVDAIVDEFSMRLFLGVQYLSLLHTRNLGTS